MRHNCRLPATYASCAASRLTMADMHDNQVGVVFKLISNKNAQQLPG